MYYAVITWRNYITAFVKINLSKPTNPVYLYPEVFFLFFHLFSFSHSQAIASAPKVSIRNNPKSIRMFNGMFLSEPLLGSL